MKTFLSTVTFLVLWTNIYGQIPIHLGAGIDTVTVEHKEIISFWTEYLKSKPSKTTTEYLDFWNENDRNLFKQPDLILHSINTEISTFAMGYPTILSVLPYKENYFEIKTVMGWAVSTGHIDLLSITNHYVKKEAGNYKLFMPLNIKDDVGLIEQDDFRIYSLKTTEIPQKVLEELGTFISMLKSDFGITESKKLTIIYGKNNKETEKILGFDFNLMSSTNNPSSGISDLSNNLIIINGLPVIFHETVHIYLNPLFPNSRLLEGLATFYGGSMGKSLIEGITNFNEYVTKNNNINLYEKLHEESFYTNNEYNPIYTLQGLLILIASEKGGVAEIKKILDYNDLDKIFAEYFNLKGSDEIDRFIKSELTKRARISDENKR